MKAIIANFRGGRHTKSSNQMILKVEGIDSKDKAKTLLGKTVSWKSPGKEPKEIKGKISGVHGNSGCVRVIFERGMPGQAIGQEILVS
ncbi:MAG: 50S ribosomal protein L35ae [Nanoarchaeota archaeon]